MQNLFDSPTKILIVAIVIIVLFGSRKLPDAARSLGKSMRILKSEVQGLHDEPSAPAQATTVQATQAQIQAAAPAQPVNTVQPVSAAQPVDAQAQIDALQQQLDSLKEQAK